LQLGIFIRQIVTFDFGSSWSTGESVTHILATRIGPSLTVMIPMTVLETAIAIALALAIAFVRGSLTDRAVMVACTVGMSISILVYMIVFQYWFAFKWHFFPVQGWGESFGENLFRYAPLPILIGLAVSVAPTLRLFRSFVLDGDNIRHGLNAGPGMLKDRHGAEFAKRFGLGFSAQDREENIRRIMAVTLKAAKKPASIRGHLRRKKKEKLRDPDIKNG